MDMKWYFKLLLCFFDKLKYEIRNFVCLYTEIETKYETNGFSIFKITEHWNPNLFIKFIYCFNFNLKNEKTKFT